jgi:hypothetical protein
LIGRRAILERHRAGGFDFLRTVLDVAALDRASWRNAKHRQQWENTLATYAFPTFGSVPVAEVDVGMVMRVIEPLWSTKPETASRVRGRVEVALDWAKARGFRPARWRGHLSNLLPARSKVQAVKHHAALPYAEIGAFLADLRKREVPRPPRSNF